MLRERMLRAERLVAVVAIAFLLLGLVEAGIASGIVVEEACSELESLVENVSWSRIFLNNLRAMSLMALPFLGPPYSLAIAFVTGTALNCVVEPGGRGLYMLAIAASPVTYLELLAYSTVIVSSTLLSVDIARRRPIIPGVLDLGLSYGIAALLLLASAVLETLLISVGGPGM